MVSTCVRSTPAAVFKVCCITALQSSSSASRQHPNPKSPQYPPSHIKADICARVYKRTCE